MPAPSADKVILDVETVDEIFTAPAPNPFAAGGSTVLGQAGLDWLMTRLQVQPLRSWEGVQLVVRLPEDQITSDLEARLTAAIRRYCTIRVEENHLQVGLVRKQRVLGLIVVTVLVLAVLVTVTLLFSTVFADASPTVQGLVTAVVGLFAWVIIWDPLQALMFEWVPPARQNRAMGRLMNMRVVVEARP